MSAPNDNAEIVELPKPRRWFEFLKNWKDDTQAAFEAWEKNRLASFRQRKIDETNKKNFAKRYGSHLSERPNPDFDEAEKGGTIAQK